MSLAISAQLVEMMGGEGEIWVVGDRRSGSTFHFTCAHVWQRFTSS